MQLLSRTILILLMLFFMGCSEGQTSKLTTKSFAIGSAKAIGVQNNTLVIYELNEKQEQHDQALVIRVFGSESHAGEAELVLGHAMDHHQMRRPNSGMAIPIIVLINFEVFEQDQLVWSGNEITSIQVVASEAEILACEWNSLSK